MIPAANTTEETVVESLGDASVQSLDEAVELGAAVGSAAHLDLLEGVHFQLGADIPPQLSTVEATQEQQLLPPAGSPQEPAVGSGRESQSGEEESAAESVREPPSGEEPTAGSVRESQSGEESTTESIRESQSKEEPAGESGSQSEESSETPLGGSAKGSQNASSGEATGSVVGGELDSGEDHSLPAPGARHLLSSEWRYELEEVLLDTAVEGIPARDGISPRHPDGIVLSHDMDEEVSYTTSSYY